MLPGAEVGRKYWKVCLDLPYSWTATGGELIISGKRKVQGESGREQAWHRAAIPRKVKHGKFNICPALFIPKILTSQGKDPLTPFTLTHPCSDPHLWGKEESFFQIPSPGHTGGTGGPVRIITQTAPGSPQSNLHTKAASQLLSRQGRAIISLAQPPPHAN